MNRRDILKSTLTGAAIATTGISALATTPKKSKHNFTFCLNTSTIRKQNIGLMAEIETAAKVGFDGIEIWMGTLEKFVKDGGKLAAVKKKSNDLGIVIEDSIGFAKWIVDDEVERGKAMEQLKKEMDMLAQIGCKRIAAPPFGATNEPGLNLQKAAERFHEVVALGKEMGVLPQLELWGFSKNLHLFGETLFVAAESGHPDAIILPDVYHLFRGGSPFEALSLIAGNKMQMFHMNDYPVNSDKNTITDAMRVMPGDGVAPFKEILGILNKKETPIVLSLEIFNEDVWKMDPLAACKMGIEKMKRIVEVSL
ncbi:sugar phosphate isomerase/epimerase [Lacihabitans sp. LS3-19]|uniref:sugar phosphate isomerase/epimerase family protein n=1 Tax=Lacihabitans sp. LS3-19 TaxID=2487335 RepID=UPI0020CF7791|nr:sugar phosphate isomerase/epimerase [Lacihabitans sp. LS3-19]MCP9768868.1 sugar phosphate isomerase/epimerase [Lacihabitans sp. LS3-19]